MAVTIHRHISRTVTKRVNVEERRGSSTWGNFYAVTAEIHQIGNESPYFAITYEATPIKNGRKWPQPHSFGTPGAEKLARIFGPSHIITRLFRWHLTSLNGPMHYEANAQYWRGLQGWCRGGPNDPPNEKHLHSTIIYGACPRDHEVDPMRLGRASLVRWLRARKPRLMRQFHEDMIGLFGWASYPFKDDARRFGVDHDRPFEERAAEARAEEYRAARRLEGIALRRAKQAEENAKQAEARARQEAARREEARRQMRAANPIKRVALAETIAQSRATERRAVADMQRYLTEFRRQWQIVKEAAQQTNRADLY